MMTFNFGSESMTDLDYYHSDFVVLDTETTGLDSRAEIVEISIIDKQGNTLFDSLIKPEHPIPWGAERIHGISNDDVGDAPAWPEVYSQVRDILSADGRTVAIYNADYDIRIIQQTSVLHGLDYFDFDWVCMMLQYAKYWGVWDDYRGNYKWQKLTNAARQQGIEIANAHRALGDCLMTLAVMDKMYEL